MSRHERVFGLETEYAVAAVTSKGSRRVPAEALTLELLRVAKARLPHLPDMHSGGLYLGNGARLYIDCGHHPEYATPEVLDPWEAVRHSLAGDEIVAGLLREVAARFRRGIEVALFRSNVDYSGGTTWGSHESYLTRCTPAELGKEILPHLVTRIIYTGAGGFDNRAPGAEFILSPRVPHLAHVKTTSSTHSRGILHLKDEPLCRGGYHRLHLLCGESLCSQKATWLRVATTALVIALSEGGVMPGEAVALRAPLRAIRKIAGDPSLKVRVRVRGASAKTAIEIQRHYLELAERHADASFMPAWAGEVCREWRSILDDLSAGRKRVARTLDWAIKLALYEDHARRHGMEWEDLVRWSADIREARRASREGAKGDTQAGPEPAGPPPHSSGAAPSPGGAEGADATRFENLRHEFFELDTRFAQVGERGVFRALDRAGVLDHRVGGIGDIESAMRDPPARGRARLRGRWVQELQRSGAGGTCDWTAVWDPANHRMLDLSDPLGEKEEWRSGDGAFAWVPSRLYC